MTETMQMHYLIHAAADLIDRGWTTHVCARDAAGDPIKSHEACAVSWCVVGALLRATRDLGLPQHLETRTREQVSQFLGGSLVLWNDWPGQTGAIVASTLRVFANRLATDDDTRLEHEALLEIPIDTGEFVDW
jgi:hypothetical protein